MRSLTSVKIFANLKEHLTILSTRPPKNWSLPPFPANIQVGEVKRRTWRGVMQYASPSLNGEYATAFIYAERVRVKRRRTGRA